MHIVIDKDGMIIHPRVKLARSPAIERSKRTAMITGIVVQQTDASTTACTLNSYKRHRMNGAHFLIDLDGTIYQTAAIYQRTDHVGLLKARCLAIGTCTPKDYAKTGVPGMHRIEMRKAVGERYPSNMEAIGIEMVGRAELPKGFKPTLEQAKDWTPEKIRGKFGVYPNPTDHQNSSLTWLLEALQDSMKPAPNEVFKHPEVSRKNETEAQGANWKLTPPNP